jgi:glycosyltransferase involved in cell wall biosynthesis
VDSILNQTYQNIEVILVNDGSTDKSLDIMNQYYINHPKVVYQYQKNAGLGAARNTGIELSSGEFLCFVDSDDWLRRDAIELMVNALEEDKSDIAICNMAYIFPDGTKRKRVPAIRQRECIDNVEALKQEMIGQKYKFHVPNKVCRRRLFVDNGIRFPEGKLYEDVATTYKLFLNKCKVSLVPEELYYYLQKRTGSITNTVSHKQFRDMFEALNFIICNPKIQAMGLRDVLQVLYVDNVISLANYIIPLYLKGNQWEDYYNLLNQDDNWYMMGDLWDNKELDVVKKIRGMLIRSHFPIYCKVLGSVKKVK